MMQALRSKSKIIGLGILAVMALGVAVSTFQAYDNPSTVAPEIISTELAPGSFNADGSTARPAPVAPIVYHFDEATQSWVSPGQAPLPLNVTAGEPVEVEPAAGAPEVNPEPAPAPAIPAPATN